MRRIAICFIVEVLFFCGTRSKLCQRLPRHASFTRISLSLHPIEKFSTIETRTLQALNQGPNNSSDSRYELNKLLESGRRPKFHQICALLTQLIENVGTSRSGVIISEYSRRQDIPENTRRQLKSSFLQELVRVKDVVRATALVGQMLDEGHLCILDSPVVASLLQLRISVQIDSPKKREVVLLPVSQLYSNVSTKLRREHRQQAASVVSLYSRLAAMEPSWQGPAADRIHECGARALCATSDFAAAVQSVSRISPQHLATPAVQLFCRQLLDRLMARSDAVSESRSSSSSAVDGVGDGVDSLATQLALLQPLNLLCSKDAGADLVDAGIKYISQLADSPRHYPSSLIVIRELVHGLQQTAVITASTTLSPLSIHVELTQELLRRLFDRNCSPDELLEVLDLSYFTELRDRDGPIALAVTTILRTAYLLKLKLKGVDNDPKAAVSDDDEARLAREFAVRMVEMPAMVVRALHSGRDGDRGGDSGAASLAISQDSDAGTGTGTGTGAVNRATSINAALRLLLLSLRRVGLEQEGWAVLQSIADRDRDSLWVPDPNLFAQGLGIGSYGDGIPSDSGVSGTSSGSGDDREREGGVARAAARALISQVRAGQMPQDYMLTTIFRAAEEPSAGLYVEAVSLWDALSSHAPLCCLGGPVLAAAIRFGIAADADANTDTVLEIFRKSLAAAVTVAASVPDSPTARAGVPDSSSKLFAAFVNVILETSFAALRHSHKRQPTRSTTGASVAGMPLSMMELLDSSHPDPVSSQSIAVSTRNIEAALSISIDASDDYDPTVATAAGVGGNSQFLDLVDYLTLNQPEDAVVAALSRNVGMLKMLLTASAASAATAATAAPGRVNEELNRRSSNSSRPDRGVAAGLKTFSLSANSSVIDSDRALRMKSLALKAFDAALVDAAAGSTAAAVSTIRSGTMFAAAIELVASDMSHSTAVTAFIEDVMEEEEETFSRCLAYHRIGRTFVLTAATSPASPTSGAFKGSSNIVNRESRAKLMGGLVPLSCALLSAAKKYHRAGDAFRILGERIQDVYSQPRAGRTKPANVLEERKGKKAAAGSAPVVNVRHPPITSKECLLLRQTAIENGRKSDLALFWTQAMRAYGGLWDSGAAAFEVLNAHVINENATGVVYWAKSLSTESTVVLSPAQTKAILSRYSEANSLQCLPELLPWISRLTASQTELIEEDEQVADADAEVEAETGAKKDRSVRTRQEKSSNKRRAFAAAATATPSLPLSMAFLRGLAQGLILQRRDSDAMAILRCVHPKQWPYDDLLQCLAEKNKISDALDVLHRLDDLIDGDSDVETEMLVRSPAEAKPIGTLGPTTARLLLAMKPEPVKEPIQSSSSNDQQEQQQREQLQQVRARVARAMQSQRAAATGSTIRASASMKNSKRVPSTDSVSARDRDREGSSIIEGPWSGSRSLSSLLLSLESGSGSLANGEGSRPSQSRSKRLGRAEFSSDGDADTSGAERSTWPELLMSTNEGDYITDRDRLQIAGSLSVAQVLTESDVKSGLLAMLTLYNMTSADVDTDADSADTELSASISEDSRGTVLSVTTEVTVSVPAATSSHSVAVPLAADTEAVKPESTSSSKPSSPTSPRWVDPECPENLAKFTADVASLGQQRRLAASKANSDYDYNDDDDGDDNNSTEGCADPTHGASSTDISSSSSGSSVGLRVSGSKKAWKRSPSYGVHYDRTGSSAAKTLSPTRGVDIDICADTGIDSDGAVGTAAADESTRLISHQLAESLLAELTKNAAAGTFGQTQTQTQSRLDYRERRRLMQRNRMAVEELFAKATPISDCFYSSYPKVSELTVAVLRACAAMADAGTAVVLTRALVARGKMGFSEQNREINLLLTEVAEACSRSSDQAVQTQASQIFDSIRPLLSQCLKDGYFSPEELRSVDGLPARLLAAGSLARLKAIAVELQGDRDDAYSAGSSPVSSASASASAVVTGAIRVFRSHGIPVSTAFASDMMQALVDIGEVDLALVVLRTVLQTDTEVASAAYESLARGLFRSRRVDMGIAILQLLHSRGYLCKPSLYSYVFSRLLRSSPPSPSSSSSSNPFMGRDVKGRSGGKAAPAVDRELSSADADTGIDTDTDNKDAGLTAALSLLREVAQVATGNIGSDKDSSNSDSSSDREEDKQSQTSRPQPPLASSIEPRSPPPSHPIASTVSSSREQPQSSSSSSRPAGVQRLDSRNSFGRLVAEGLLKELAKSGRRGPEYTTVVTRAIEIEIDTDINTD